jgi:hypothetical protein
MSPKKSDRRTNGPAADPLADPAPRRRPGRPSHQDPPSTTALPAISPAPNQDLYNIYNIFNIDKIDGKKNILIDCNIEELMKEVDDCLERIGEKGILSTKEMKFLYYALSEKMPILKALKISGILDDCGKKISERTCYRLAERINKKYEAHEADHRKIFRAIGLGEIRIALGILALCDDPEKRWQAKGLELASKNLGLQKEYIEGSQGVTVIIQGPDAAVKINQGIPGQPPLPHQAPVDGPTYRHPNPAIPGKPIKIID